MAINFGKAFETDQDGYAITDDSGNVLAYFSAGSGGPFGASAPINTWYFRTDNNLLYYKFGAGINDWRQVRGQDIAFDNTGLKFNATQVYQALTELRSNTVLSVDPLTSTLNGNHNITQSDSNIHLVTGTATGYSVTLPDATGLFIGRRFEVANSSIESIDIKSFNGAILFTVVPGDTIILTLLNNGTSGGVWIATTVTSTAAGITSYVISDQNAFITTSLTDVLVTGQTVTPVAGRYAVYESAEFLIAQNNRVAEGVIYVDGVADADSRRVVQGVGSNYQGGFNTLTEVNVNGVQAVDFRVNISSGQLQVTGRTLLLIRLGAQT